jgi:hypothetical protein
MNGKKHVSRIGDVIKFGISVLETVSVKVETSLASQIAKLKGHVSEKLDYGCLDVLAGTECNDKVLVVIIASLHRFLPLSLVGTSSLERRTIQYVSLRDHVAHPKVAYIITLMKLKFYDSNCDFQQI